MKIKMNRNICDNEKCPSLDRHRPQKVHVFDSSLMPNNKTKIFKWNFLSTQQKNNISFSTSQRGKWRDDKTIKKASLSNMKALQWGFNILNMIALEVVNLSRKQKSFFLPFNLPFPLLSSTQQQQRRTKNINNKYKLLYCSKYFCVCVWEIFQMVFERQTSKIEVSKWMRRRQREDFRWKINIIIY